jgi:hypothetical protein
METVASFLSFSTLVACLRNTYPLWPRWMLLQVIDVIVRTLLPFIARHLSLFDRLQREGQGLGRSRLVYVKFFSSPGSPPPRLAHYPAQGLRLSPLPGGGEIRFEFKSNIQAFIHASMENNTLRLYSHEASVTRATILWRA